MNKSELISEFRALAQDAVGPDYLFSNDQIGKWLAQAEQEAVIRSRLLHESSDAGICEIAVSAGESVYPLHPALYEITHLSYRPDGARLRSPVCLSSVETLDDQLPDWRDRSGTPTHAIQSNTTIRLALTPTASGTLHVEGYRLPIRGLAVGDKPEIHQAHHAYLVHWALHRAFSVPDAESIDPTRAARAEAEFTDYFGLRTDSDLRRITQHDDPHHNKAWP